MRPASVRCSEPVVRLFEVVEQYAVHALLEIELAFVLLPIPIPARFDAMYQVANLKGIRIRIKGLDEALFIERPAVLVGGEAGQRVDPDRMAANDGQNAGQTLVQRSEWRRAIRSASSSSTAKKNGGRHALDAEHGRSAEVAQRGSQGTGVAGVADFARVLVELPPSRRPYAQSSARVANIARGP